MRPSYKDTFREIKNTFGRFLSILLIVAVGVGFYSGVKSTSPSMYHSAEDYFNEQSLMDITILSSVGFDDSDVDAIRTLEHIDKVMPAYSADLVTRSDGEAQVARVMSLPGEGDDSINTPYIKEGRMPEAENECLLTKSALLDCSLQLGDEIEFEPEAGSEKVDAILKQRRFQIVGIIELPQYISYTYGTASIGSGMIALAVMIPQSNFLYSRYTEMYVTLDCHREGIMAFDKEYQPLVDEISVTLEQLGDLQFQAFINNAESQINDAESEMEKSRQEADEKLDDSLSELNDAKQQIEDGWEEYNASSASANYQIHSAQRKIADAEAQIAAGEQELKASQQEYEEQSAAASQQLADARSELDDGWAVYNANNEAYQAALQQYNESLSAYNSAVEEFTNAQTACASAEQALSALEAELAAAPADNHEVTDQEIAYLNQALSAAEGELNSYRASIGSLEPGSEEYNQMAALISTLEGEVAYYRQRISELQSQRTVSNAELQAEVSRARGTLSSAQQRLAAAQAAMASKEAELNAAAAELAQAEAELNAARSELEDQEAVYASSQKELDDAKAALEQGQQQIADSKAQLADARKQLNYQAYNAQTQLNEAKKQLTESEKQYQEGLIEYNEAVKSVEEELASAKSRIRAARSDLRSIEVGKWYVLDRDTVMVGFSGYKSDAKRVDTIANVFALFFMLVAVLVCMSNMTRMVSEQRVNIGTYKALGYSSGQIASKYLIYAALASAGGCILGAAVFIPFTPPIIFAAYDLVYMLPEFSVSASGWSLTLAIFVAMLSTILVAWFTCRKELSSSAASLMRPKAPPAGKTIFLERIPALWKRFSFFQKLTARNLFRYKMRLMMTVIGIAGCMALVVSGFGLRDAIVDITDIQFSEIEFEDMLISFDNEYTFEDIQAEAERIDADERLADTLLMLKEDCVVLRTDETESLGDTYLYMPHDTTRADKLLNLRTPDTKEALSWAADGVIVTEKIARNMGADIGDEVIMRIGDDDYTVRIAGIAECYVYNYIFITPEYYEAVTGKGAAYNTVYASESDKMIDRKVFSSEWLEKSDKITTILYASTIRKAIDDNMYGMEYIVLFMIFCAGLLACIVLYNLTNANLSERLREIATVKVLGFNRREVNMYVFRDNLIMSVFGILLGSVIGLWLTLYMIKAVEVSMITFIMRVAPRCYLYSAGITLTFTVLINLFMTKQVQKISMVESLKAVE